MGLAQELGIDPEIMSWEDWAACKGMGFSNFFDTPAKSDEDESVPPGYDDEVIAKSVDELCFNCPVQQACGTYGMQNRLEGVWGGVYLNARGQPDKTRNAHKSSSRWKKLKELFGI